MKYEYIDTDTEGVAYFYNEKIIKNKYNAFIANLEDYERYYNYIQKDWIILDAGCGVGHLINYLNQKKIRCKGIDISRESIKLAKNLNLDVELLDLQNLYFNNNSFDCVFCLGVLEHIPNIIKAINELYRVSSKRIIINVPLWHEGIDEIYKKELLPNVERWLPEKEWDKLLLLDKIELLFKNYSNNDIEYILNKK